MARFPPSTVVSVITSHPSSIRSSSRRRSGDATTHRTLNYDGYRVVGGIGTERISLFNGELYGGVMAANFADPTIAQQTWPIFGGRVSWFPTRFVTCHGRCRSDPWYLGFQPELPGVWVGRKN